MRAVAGSGQQRLTGVDQAAVGGVQRREVSARARGDPAAEGRELERLREVPQRQTVLGELLLEVRADRARLDPRRLRDGVDLEHAVERLKVDRDRTGVLLAEPRLD